MKQLMVKQIVLYIATFVILVGVVSGLYLYIEKDKDVASDSALPETSVNNTAQPNSSQLQVQSAQNTVPSSTLNESNDLSRLPEPSEFTVYEEYANGDTALYIDIETGTGKEAQQGNKLAVVYSGWLTNGQQFDASTLNEQNQLEPFIFELGAGQVIPGWEQGIFGMKEGGTRRLIIPSAAGYGPNGQGPIPPNAMLIFDVQLVQLQE